LKILTECGLVTIKQEGRERYCTAKLKPLNDVSVWLDQYRQHWEDKFDALDDYLKRMKAPKRRTPRR
jgi:DNA-binding transcriptional ArsR family regulator